MLKKEFNRKDVTRARNLIMGKSGASSETQIGYKKKKMHIDGIQELKIIDGYRINLIRDNLFKCPENGCEYKCIAKSNLNSHIQTQRRDKI